MNKTAELKVVTRRSNKKERNSLRNEGYLLGSINGKDTESLAIAVKNDEFRHALNKYGRNSVFKIETSDNQSITAMVKDIQIGHLGLELQHVDFQRVSLTEEIKTEATIKLIGQDILDGKKLIVNRQVDILTVSGLPQAIPDSIDIDLSNAKDGDVISVSDLIVPEGIVIEHESELVILSVNEAKVQVEETEDGEEDVVTSEVSQDISE